MIRQRVKAGLNTVKAKIARDGKFTSKAGIVRTNLGRPGARADAIEQAKQLLAGGKGILNTARACGLGTGTVQRLKQEMAVA
jgi:DNA invertase Pin-like site-specific DNA recombinase